MAKARFSKSEAIRFGWNVTLKNLAFFVFVLIILGAIAFLPKVASFLGSFPLYLSSLAAQWVLSIIAAIGLTAIALKFAEKRKPKVQDLFLKSNLFFSYLISSVLAGAIVFVGFLLLIIPGIIWSVRFQFYPYFIVEEGAGPIEALKKSWNLTQGTAWNLILFSLMLAGIQILGVLALFVGLIFTTPTTWVARAFVYKELKKSKS
ncbi:MAG: DUF975 family protein [bacterium]|nr:DUF975 family protein [bacterium]